MAAKAAQALNAGDLSAFNSISVDPITGEMLFTAMLDEFSRPGWESGTCREVGPLYACRMIKGGREAGELIMEDTGSAILIVTWTGPPS